MLAIIRFIWSNLLDQESDKQILKRKIKNGRDIQLQMNEKLNGY